MNNRSISITIYIVFSISVLVTLFYSAILIKEVFTKQRCFKSNGSKGVITVLTSFGIMAGFAFCFYNAPQILYNGISWEMIKQIGPSNLFDMVLCLSVLIPILVIYFLLTYFFEKPNEKPYFMVVILSIVSGIGNSLIVFIINNALNRSMAQYSRRIGVESGLYLYYLFGIMLFLIGSYIVRVRLINFTNQVIYELRMSMIQKIMHASFHRFELMKDEKIYSALNNDPEIVSNSVNMLVNFFTSFVMMVTCFIYLGALNLLAMLLSLFVIGVATVLFLRTSMEAKKFFEKNRDYQTIFFKNIKDLVGGYKELYLNKDKRNEFHNELNKNCGVHRDSRISGETKFVGVTVFGSILYLLVIGIVVFVFPYLFNDLRNVTIRDYVTVYLYLGNIVNQQINQIQNIMRILVSWRRIQAFIKEISEFDVEYKEILDNTRKDKLSLRVKDVVFEYKTENSENFSIGPINCTFHSGEITFITGGNGSGKSTLAKIITGLYIPDKGEITINGLKVEPRELSNHFTTVYSDFYIFDKLFGINCKKKEAEIEKYLEMLCIKDKVTIKDGEFSTVKLSTGQRKRLALLISYLEDKPIFLFDEWTADQDPEFRMFFYNVLLPGLKQQGKVVIAITHDDRYFNYSDSLIKMEMGQIIGCQDKPEAIEVSEVLSVSM